VSIHVQDRDRVEEAATSAGGRQPTSPATAAGSLAAAADQAVSSVRAATARRRQQRGVDVLFAGAPAAQRPAAEARTEQHTTAEPHPTELSTATTAPPGPPRRSLVLSSLQVAGDDAEATVSLTLRGDARTATGVARAIAGRTAVLRAVATAVLQAAHEVTDGPVRGELVSVEVGTGVPPIATAVVELLGPGGRSRCVVGAAVVGDAPHQAVARATLDAIDRSVTTVTGA
jgi:hypothetical protein